MCLLSPGDPFAGQLGLKPLKPLSAIGDVVAVLLHGLQPGSETREHAAENNAPPRRQLCRC